MNSDDIPEILNLVGLLCIFTFLCVFGLAILAKRADEIRRDMKAIRAMIAAGLQAETPEARRMAASIHNAKDES